MAPARWVIAFAESAIALVAVGALATACSAAELRNGGFEQTSIRDSGAPGIAAMAKVGWTFPSPLRWPDHWEGSAGVSNVRFAVVSDAPHAGQNCVLLWGQAGSSGYLSTRVTGLQRGIYRLSFWGRGKGTATLMFASTHVVLNAQMSDTWAEYCGVYRNGAATEAPLSIQAQKAEVFFDDVSVAACDVLEAALAEESMAMRKEGTWLAPGAGADGAGFRANVAELVRVLPALVSYVEADPIPDNVALVRLLRERAARFEQITDAPAVAQANEAAACARIGRRLVTELQFEDVEE